MREITDAELLADEEWCLAIVLRTVGRRLDEVEQAIAAGDELGAHRAAARAATLLDELRAVAPPADLAAPLVRLEKLRAAVAETR